MSARGPLEQRVGAVVHGALPAADEPAARRRAARGVRCPICEGQPHRYDAGCIRCGESGTVLPDEVPEQPRYAVPVYALERARGAVLGALAGSRVYGVERERAAAVLVEGLSHAGVVIGEATLAGVQLRAGVDELGARHVLEAYVAALREHARAIRPRREPRDRRELERARDAERCEAHARRVEGALPWWARAAE